MGVLFGKLTKKKYTYDFLEKLDDDIKENEEFKRCVESKLRTIKRQFLIASVYVYITIASICYILFLNSVIDGQFYTILLVSAVVLIFSARHILMIWYTKQIRQIQVELSTLKDEKQQIIDVVTESEDYKIAKKIFFDNLQSKPKGNQDDRNPYNLLAL